MSAQMHIEFFSQVLYCVSQCTKTIVVNVSLNKCIVTSDQYMPIWSSRRILVVMLVLAKAINRKERLLSSMYEFAKKFTSFYFIKTINYKINTFIKVR